MSERWIEKLLQEEADERIVWEAIQMYLKGEEKMKDQKELLQDSRTATNIEMCWDEETKEFDWIGYQYLCDIADYWECEE